MIDWMEDHLDRFMVAYLFLLFSFSVALIVGLVGFLVYKGVTSL